MFANATVPELVEYSSPCGIPEAVSNCTVAPTTAFPWESFMIAFTVPFSVTAASKNSCIVVSVISREFCVLVNPAEGTAMRFPQFSGTCMSIFPLLVVFVSA